MRYLVTGGAGFVGSHVASALINDGHEVTVLDNLSTGHRKAIPQTAQFRQADLLDIPTLKNILREGPWDGVLHFAALSLVGASMIQPYHYLRQNLLTSLNLIEACVEFKVPRFLFSSTAALFKNDDNIPLSETSPITPSSPYGESKFLIERTLHWAQKIHNLQYGCLRYFNAAGADPQGLLGEDHRPETHLIPLAIDATLKRRPPLKLFGSDYPTPDGTCIRDYVHVCDLADAHLRVLNHIDTKSVTYNIGTGTGFSNLEVLQAIERVIGEPVPWEWAPRREGDPAILVTDPSRIRQELNWEPKFTKLDHIIETAYRWRLSHPNGYDTP